MHSQTSIVRSMYGIGTTVSVWRTVIEINAAQKIMRQVVEFLFRNEGRESQLPYTCVLRSNFTFHWYPILDTIPSL